MSKAKAVVYLNLGSNIDKQKNIVSGIAQLRASFGTVHLSSVYESPPVGFKGESFYNLAARIETNLPLVKLSEHLKLIEDRHGRVRDPAFKGRSLDIDIVLYDKLMGNFEGIELPRPELYFNSFVLCPMAELAGDLIDVKTGLSYRALWEKEREMIAHALVRVDIGQLDKIN